MLAPFGLGAPTNLITWHSVSRLEMSRNPDVWLYIVHEAFWASFGITLVVLKVLDRSRVAEPVDGIVSEEVWAPTPVLWIAAVWMAVGSDLRARAEERLLEQAFGATYRDYCRRTSRFVPGLS